MDLYLAQRSDAPHLLKIGRSSNAISRCRQLQTGHCFKIHVVALWVGFGAREKAVHRALQDYRIENSEWFAVDWLTAVAAIKAAQPEEAKTCKYDLEAIARRNKLRGRTLKSTRYPHLNDPLPA